MKSLLLPLCIMTLLSASSCGSLGFPHKNRIRSPLNIVTICNKYIPKNAPAPVSHHVDQVRQFNNAVELAGVEGASLASVSKEDFTHEEFIDSIERYDGPDTLTVAYIASHGSPEGFILAEPLGFEELYNRLESRVKGKILLVVDMCYAGLINDVLAKHHSSRIFAVTGTKGSTTERWYAESGSFGRAVSATIIERASWGRDRKLTLGEFYDGVEAKIERWNIHYRHSSGHITEAGMYGPRDLVVFDFAPGSS